MSATKDHVEMNGADGGRGHRDMGSPGRARREYNSEGLEMVAPKGSIGNKCFSAPIKLTVETKA